MSQLGIPGDYDARKRGDALLRPTGTPAAEATGIREVRTDVAEGTDANAAGLTKWETAQLAMMAGTMKALADAQATKIPWKFLVRSNVPQLVMNRPHVLLKFIANNGNQPVTVSLAEMDPGNSADPQLVITIAANAVANLGNVGCPFVQRLSLVSAVTTGTLSVLLSGDYY